MNWFENIINSTGYKAFMHKITIMGLVVTIAGVVMLLMKKEASSVLLDTGIGTLFFIGLFRLAEIIYKRIH